jgi:hypothetical protein
VDNNLSLSLPDPRRWAGDVFLQALTALLRVLSAGLRGLVGTVLGSSLNFVTQTPPAGSYDSPTVGALWGVVRAIALAALGLLAAWSGFALLLRGHTGVPAPDLWERLPRLALGGLAASTSLWWGRLAIDANNALCQAIGQASLPAFERANAATQGFFAVLATLVYLATSLLLLLQMLMRLALVDVLLVASPLALACWAVPELAGWTRQWAAAFTATVFVQFLQVLALKLGGSLLTELAPMAPDAAVLALFLGVAVLLLTLRLPGLVRAHAGDGLGLVRLVVYRQVAGALAGRSTAGGMGSG